MWAAAVLRGMCLRAAGLLADWARAGRHLACGQLKPGGRVHEHFTGSYAWLGTFVVECGVGVVQPRRPAYANACAEVFSSFGTGRYFSTFGRRVFRLRAALVSVASYRAGVAPPCGLLGLDRESYFQENHTLWGSFSAPHAQLLVCLLLGMSERRSSDLSEARFVGIAGLWACFIGFTGRLLRYLYVHSVHVCCVQVHE